MHPHRPHRRAWTRLALIGGLIALALASAGPGEVVLTTTGGRSIIGEITSESDTDVVIDVYRGFTRTIPKASIVNRTEVSRSQPDDRRQFAARLTTLPSDDIPARAALVHWARDKGIGLAAGGVLHELAQRHGSHPALADLLPARTPRPRLAAAEQAFLESQIVEFFAQPDRRDAVLAALAGQDVLPADSVEAWAKRCFAEARKGPKVTHGDFKFPHSAPDFVGRGRIELWTKAGPTTRTDGEPWPVLISLHGGGLNVGTWKDGASVMMRPLSKHFDRILLVAPNVLHQRYAEWGGYPIEEVYVRELFKAVKRTWAIDTNRVFLAGYSMGGYGTWHIGSGEADLFAGLVSGAGGLLIGQAWGWGSVGNLMHTPIAFLHGGKDQPAPPWSDQECSRILTGLAKSMPGCYRSQFLFYPDAGHMVPGQGIDKAVAWVAPFVREPNPKHICWEPKQPFNNQLYWLRLSQPRLFQRLDARIADNTVRVQTHNVNGGLTILLNRHLADLAKSVTVQVDGQTVFQGIVQPTLSTLLMTVDSRLDERLWYPVRIDL